MSPPSWDYRAGAIVTQQARSASLTRLPLGALAFYIALTAIALSLDDGAARYVVGAGWIAHAGWDAVHHRANRWCRA